MLKALKRISKAMWREIKYFVSINLRYLASLLDLVCPYGMYVLGQLLAKQRGYTAVGGEVFIPVAVLFITYYLREAANAMHKGSRIPVPEKRFTTVSEDGEVSINQDRLQELILYVGDIEDWFERKGWL